MSEVAKSSSTPQKKTPNSRNRFRRNNDVGGLPPEANSGRRNHMNVGSHVRIKLNDNNANAAGGGGGGSPKAGSRRNFSDVIVNDGGGSPKYGGRMKNVGEILEKNDGGVGSPKSGGRKNLDQVIKENDGDGSPKSVVTRKNFINEITKQNDDGNSSPKTGRRKIFNQILQLNDGTSSSPVSCVRNSSGNSNADLKKTIEEAVLEKNDDDADDVDSSCNSIAAGNFNIGNESRRKLWSVNMEKLEKNPLHPRKLRASSDSAMIFKEFDDRVSKKEFGSSNVRSKNWFVDEDVEDEEMVEEEEEEKSMVFVESNCSSVQKAAEIFKEIQIPVAQEILDQSASPTVISYASKRINPCQETHIENAPESCNRVQSLVDMVMWKDMSRSAFVFGLGSFLLLSFSYAKDLNFSLISSLSYLGLLYLAIVYVHKSIICKSSMDMLMNPQTAYKEEDALWLLRLILPYLNEILFKLRRLFSGDPATTMKVAVLLFVLARFGSSLTMWTLLKIGFFGVFTVPKVYSSYSAHLSRYVKFWIGRFRDAWNACSHKKAVVVVIFTVIWNMSSVAARIWAVFILVVAVRLYQQSCSSGWEEESTEHYHSGLEEESTEHYQREFCSS